MRSNAARPPRDKPDYHVHNHPQTETGGGAQNAGKMSLHGNTFPAAPRPAFGSLARMTKKPRKRKQSSKPARAMRKKLEDRPKIQFLGAILPSAKKISINGLPKATWKSADLDLEPIGTSSRYPHAAANA